MQASFSIDVPADEHLFCESFAFEKSKRFGYRFLLGVLLSVAVHGLFYAFVPSVSRSPQVREVEAPLLSFTLAKSAEQAAEVIEAPVDSPNNKAAEKPAPSELLPVEIPPVAEPEVVDAMEVVEVPPSETSVNSLTIFDPRLRSQSKYDQGRHRMPLWQGEGNLPSTKRIVLHDKHYFDLGNGDCLREHVGGMGISNRNSEEYLIMNVKKVRCPGDEYESEGEAMIRGLRAALKAKNQRAEKMTVLP